MQSEKDGEVTPAGVAQEVLMVNSVMEVTSATTTKKYSQMEKNSKALEKHFTVKCLCTYEELKAKSEALGLKFLDCSLPDAQIGKNSGALKKNLTVTCLYSYEQLIKEGEALGLNLVDCALPGFKKSQETKYSPHIGGRKMSSSLKNKLMNSKKYSSPISRPSISVKSIQSKVPSLEYSREDIEKALNETEPVLNKSASIAVFVISDDEDDLYEKSTSNKTSAILIDDAKESITSGEHAEFVVNSDSSKENGSETKLPENESPKKEIDVTVINEGIHFCSEQDIENYVDEELVLKIFNDLQIEFASNAAKLQELNKLKEDYIDNTPDNLKYDKKWMQWMTQLTLKKLYDFMPEPRSTTFGAFF